MNANQMRVRQLEVENRELRQRLDDEERLSKRLASGFGAVRRALGSDAREVATERLLNSIHDPPLRYRAVEPIRLVSDEEIHETVEAARAVVRMAHVHPFTGRAGGGQ